MEKPRNRLRSRTGRVFAIPWFLVLLAGILSLEAQEPGALQPSREARLSEARRILDTAWRAAMTVSTDRAVLQAVLLRDIAAAQSEGGFFSDAFLTLQAIPEDFPQAKAQALGFLALGQARQGEVEAALETVSSIPDGALKWFALRRVATVLAEEGYWGAAMQFAEEIEDEGIKDFALGSVAVRRASVGDFTGARLAAEAIQDAQRRQRIEQMIARAEQAEGNRPRLQIYEDSFPGLVLGGTQGSPEHAPFQLMFAMGMLVGAYESSDPVVTRVRELVRTALDDKQQDREQAVESLRTAVQLAASISKELDRVEQLWLVAVALAEAGEIERALKIAESLPEKLAGSELSFPRTQAIRRIAATQALAGDADGSLVWVEAEFDPVLRASGLLGIAEGILRQVHLESRPEGMPETVP